MGSVLRGFFGGFLLALTACNNNPRDPDAAEPKTTGALLAKKTVQADTVKPLPKKLPYASQEAGLYEALAGKELFAEAMRNKERTGYVVAPGKRRDMLKARRDLDAIRDEISGLSKTGVPTYALIHSIKDGEVLQTWLLAPDGGIVADAALYAPLDSIADGLGVTRIAAARGMALDDETDERAASIKAAIARDQSDAAKTERRDTLAKARAMLLPGEVAAALGSRKGRLLILPAMDTGTAPYAALPLDNGIAALNWSFVVMPDIDTLTQHKKPFAIADLDINQAVIVGDPDLSWDHKANGKPKWHPLPGARKEAQTVAALLGGDQTQLLLGTDASKQKVVAAINSSEDEGIVYLATHAVANAKFPLTQGFVALSGEHLYAGHIRQEKFLGWDKRHPLVVLSACQTALGRVFGGGGFGVAKTWMTAGAGQVVASLWNVSDPATLDLMTRFMRHLKKGQAPELAMQAAQIETMNLKNRKGDKPYFDDPKMWASFTVYGKPTIDAKPPA